MATWITHLRIAESFMKLVPGLEAGSFAIGNIAPDSGIPDEKWVKYTPKAEVTHFYAEPVSLYKIADLNFYRAYLLPLQDNPENPAVFSFRLGYYLHLVIDNLWRECVIIPTRTQHKDQFASDPHMLRKVRENWSAHDFIYVQNHPDSLFWSVFLQSQPDRAATDLDFLPLNALCQRVEYIKTYYQRRDKEIAEQLSRPMIYLSSDEMEWFVEFASDKVQEVYERLWMNGLAVGKSLTILDWIFTKPNENNV